MMQILRHPLTLRSGSRNCVATIGNFDGVHLGHQAIIHQLRGSASELRLPAVVMTFEPQPLEFLKPEAAPPRLTSFREKCKVMDGEGVDQVICLRFNAALAQLNSAEFVQRLLVNALGVRRVIIGDDFRFGRNREGDYGRLAELAQTNGFEVSGTEACQFEGSRISSSRIRASLLAGDMQVAGAMLGRPFRIIGRVIGGEQRGRKLGFPTANVDLGRRTPPLRGVFAVRVTGVQAGDCDGVANVGTRPVFGGHSVLLEVHLFGFAGDLYGRRIEVEFLHRLRDEQRFESVTQLQDQIARDCAQAQSFLHSGAAHVSR